MATSLSDDLCSCCRLPFQSCRVLLEFRRYRNPDGTHRPEGGKELLAEYMAECKKRGESSARETGLQMHKLGVPGEIVGDSIRPQDNAAMQAARRYLAAAHEQFSPFLLLLGPVGVGKTVAAAWVLRDFVGAYEWNSAPTGITQQPCMWVDARELTGTREFSPDTQNWLKAIQSTSLLVLDDAGHEATDAGRNALTDVLLSRLARNRRTVLTANLTFEDFAARYGDAVRDRLRAKSMIAQLPGKSLRQKRRA